MSRLLLTALLLGFSVILPAPLHAELDKKKWREATAEEKGQTPSELINNFFVYSKSRDLLAYSGTATVAPKVLASEESRRKFIDEVVAGAQEGAPIVLKSTRTRTVNGFSVTECIFEAPSIDRTLLGLFCLTKDRLVSLSIMSSEKKIDWDDADVKELVAHVPIK